MSEERTPETAEGGGPGQDRLLDHEYDGIREYDNRLPNWWQYILYGSIVFAVGYWLVFHIYATVPLPQVRYEQEMARAAEVQLAKMAGHEITDETLELMSAIPDRVAAGQQIFQQFCVVCHGTQGEGNVGPNLTDAYWLHGASPLQIHDTVTHGVLEKGMAAWGSQLGPSRVQQVVAYVLTLKGTNVPGKPPQGEGVGAPGEVPADVPGDAPMDASPPSETRATPAGDATDMGSRVEAVPAPTELRVEQVGQP